MQHKEKLPTGVELMFRAELENQILVQIPQSGFHLLGIRNKKGSWDIGIINRVGCYKRKIAEDIDERTFASLISHTLMGDEQESFKFKLTINKLKDHYKLLLTQISSTYKIEFDSTITL